MSHADPNYPGNLFDTLNAQDKKRIERSIKESNVHSFLKNRHKLNFNVNDVLVKIVLQYDYTDKKHSPVTEKISHASPVPKKYKCIYIDDYGIPYVKPLNVNGKEGISVINCANIDMDRYWFEQDPDQVAHVILSENEEGFDPLEAFKQNKEKREQIKKTNRLIRENTHKVSDCRAAFAKLKPGDVVYRTFDKDTCYSMDELEVEEISYHTVAEFNVGTKFGHMNSWRRTGIVNWASNQGLTDVMVVKFKPLNVTYTIEPETLENEICSIGRFWYFSKPRRATDV